MVSRKKTKSKSKRISLKRGSAKKKVAKRKPKAAHKSILVGVLKVSAIVGILVAAGVGFVLLGGLVKKVFLVFEKPATLKLVNPPGWVNEQLEEKIYAAARADGESLKIDENTAQSVQKNIEARVAWVDDVTVQTTHDSIYIKGRWRRPLAVVKSGRSGVCYVDAELVVLDFVPVSNLPVVNVKGLSMTTKAPRPGEVWHLDDLAAGVAILERLDRMDELVSADKPLLFEIDSIDVSNFNGRRGSGPHIVLYAKDNTEIMWGAELGAWSRYLESTDEEKLDKLYSYYKEYGSLLNNVKYINLCEPRGNIPRPVDKY